LQIAVIIEPWPTLYRGVPWWRFVGEHVKECRPNVAGRYNGCTVNSAGAGSMLVAECPQGSPWLTSVSKNGSLAAVR
jgi:hypothetical protein